MNNIYNFPLFSSLSKIGDSKVSWSLSDNVSFFLTHCSCLLNWYLEFLQNFFFLFLFWNGNSYNTYYPRTWYGIKDEVELPVLLSLCPKWWGHWYIFWRLTFKNIIEANCFVSLHECYRVYLTGVGLFKKILDSFICVYIRPQSPLPHWHMSSNKTIIFQLWGTC